MGISEMRTELTHFTPALFVALLPFAAPAMFRCRAALGLRYALFRFTISNMSCLCGLERG